MNDVSNDKTVSGSGSENQTLTLFGGDRRITQSKLDEITSKCDSALETIIRPLAKVTDFRVTSEVENSFDIFEWIFSIENQGKTTPFAYISARNSGMAVKIKKLRVANALQRKGIGTEILNSLRQLVEMAGFTNLMTEIEDPGNPKGIKKVRIESILGLKSQGSAAASVRRMTDFFAKQGFKSLPVFAQESGMILNLEKK